MIVMILTVSDEPQTNLAVNPVMCISSKFGKPSGRLGTRTLRHYIPSSAGICFPSFENGIEITGRCACHKRTQRKLFFFDVNFLNEEFVL